MSRFYLWPTDTKNQRSSGHLHMRSGGIRHWFVTISTNHCRCITTNLSVAAAQLADRDFMPPPPIKDIVQEIGLSGLPFLSDQEVNDVFCSQLLSTIQIPFHQSRLPDSDGMCPNWARKPAGRPAGPGGFEYRPSPPGRSSVIPPSDHQRGIVRLQLPVPVDYGRG